MFTKSKAYSHQDLVRIAQFTPDDLARIRKCRQDHTRLGFAYQLAYVRLYRRFPSQQALEIVDEIVTYVSLQLGIPSSAITAYQEQRSTIVTHQQELRGYLGVRRFGEAELGTLETYLFDEACRLAQTGPLLTQAKRFLRERSILYPGDEVLRRLVVKRRQAARDHIYERIARALVQSTMAKLDGMLETNDAYWNGCRNLSLHHRSRGYRQAKRESTSGLCLHCYWSAPNIVSYWLSSISPLGTYHSNRQTGSEFSVYREAAQHRKRPN